MHSIKENIAGTGALLYIFSIMYFLIVTAVTEIVSKFEIVLDASSFGVWFIGAVLAVMLTNVTASPDDCSVKSLISLLIIPPSIVICATTVSIIV